MSTEELVNAARAELFRKPGQSAGRVLTAGEQLMQRRANAAINTVSMERARKLTTALVKIEKQLIAFGEPALNLVPLVREDAEPAEVNNYVGYLQRLLEQCTPVYEWHRQQREAAQRAAETPEQRELRDLRERLAELESRSSNMSSSPRQAESADAMPFCRSNLLMPPPSFGMAPAGAPPRAARAVRGAAQRVGRSEVRLSEVAMPNTNDRLVDDSTPWQFSAACR